MNQQDRATFLTSLHEQGRDVVERLGGDWQPHGGMCRCPAHDDRTPSLSVRPGRRRLLFHCFAGCETREIMRALRVAGVFANLASDDEQKRSSPADPGQHHRRAAIRLWRASRPILQSPADRYLRNRALLLSSPELRYHPRTPYGRGAQAIFGPAMLAAIRDGSGLVAVHRTFLDQKTGNVAALSCPKRALGRLGEGAVRLLPPRLGILGWAEGIENAVAATMLTEVPCWATLGTERFAHVALPSNVERLILFLDNDAGGRRAEKLARDVHAGTGLMIEARYPVAQGADWNDVLRGR